MTAIRASLKQDYRSITGQFIPNTKATHLRKLGYTRTIPRSMAWVFCWATRTIAVVGAEDSFPNQGVVEHLLRRTPTGRYGSKVPAQLLRERALKSEGPITFPSIRH